MRNQLPRGCAGLLVACSLAFASGQSLAADPAPGNDPFAAFEVVPSQDLAAMRGRAGDLTIVSSNQEFKSTVKDSTFNVGTMNTGAATVGKQAFEGAKGAFVSVINTGIANSFTTGMNITVNLH